MAGLTGGVQQAGGFVRGFGYGLWEGGASLVESGWEAARASATGAYRLATDERAREEALQSAASAASAVNRYATAVAADPGTIVRDLGQAANGAANAAGRAWSEFDAARQQAEREGRAGEFYGRAVGRGAFEVGATVLPGGAAIKGAQGAALAGRTARAAERATDGARAIGALSHADEAARLARGADELHRTTARADADRPSQDVLIRASQEAGVDGRLRTGRGRAYLTEADPARAVLGPARISHAQEIAMMRRTMEDAGVEVRERSGAMAYSPGLRVGEPGQFIIDPDASLSAWRHEYQHFLDDRDAGWGGFRDLMNPETRWAREQAA